MPTIQLLPSDTISAGDWSVQDSDIADTLREESGEVYNTSQNQSFTLDLDDADLDEIFIQIHCEIIARRGSKGTGAFNFLIYNEEQEIISNQNFVVSNSSPSTFSTSIVNISKSSDQINLFTIRVITTGGTQVFFSKIEAIVRYGTLDPGLISLNQGLISINEGRISI